MTAVMVLSMGKWAQLHPCSRKLDQSLLTRLSISIQNRKLTFCVTSIYYIYEYFKTGTSCMVEAKKKEFKVKKKYK